MSISFKIISFDSDWRTKRNQAGGGILLDQGIHMLDMIRTISGSFNEVFSVISNDYWRHDVEDNAYALMKTKTGVVATIHSSATQWRHTFRLEIGLTDGLIVLRGILSGSQSYGDEEIIIYEKTSNDVLEKRTFEYTQDNSWRDEIDEFYSAVTQDKKIVIGSVEEALATMKLVYQIYSADQNWAAKFDLQNEEIIEFSFPSCSPLEPVRLWCRFHGEFFQYIPPDCRFRQRRDCFENAQKLLTPLLLSYQ